MQSAHMNGRYELRFGTHQSANVRKLIAQHQHGESMQFRMPSTTSETINWTKGHEARAAAD
jgi:hypothetical protein